MSGDAEKYYQETLDCLISDLKTEVIRMRVERDEAVKQEREHLITIGLLRELVGQFKFRESAEPSAPTAHKTAGAKPEARNRSPRTAASRETSGASEPFTSDRLRTRPLV